MGDGRKGCQKKKKAVEEGSRKVESGVLEEKQRGCVGAVGGTSPDESRQHRGAFLLSVC